MLLLLTINLGELLRGAVVAPSAHNREPGFDSRAELKNLGSFSDTLCSCLLSSEWVPGINLGFCSVSWVPSLRLGHWSHVRLPFWYKCKG